MSADLLRDAAALMRERAEAATAGPWSDGRFFWKVGSTRGMPDEWWASVETRRGDVVAASSTVRLARAYLGSES